jgi:hypothetical protein
MSEGLWGAVLGWLNQRAEAYVLASIPLEGGEAAPLKARESYLQVWLAEMFLAKRKQWLQTWFPTVHSEVRLPFAGQQSVTFTKVVRPADDKLGEGVLLNYPLTELVPFNGGAVEIEAALLGLKGDGDGHLAAGVMLLETFSGLVAPPLGQALGAAAKLTAGARDFLDRVGGGVHLALHQTLVSDGGGGGNVLRPGYLAVVLATEEQVPPTSLRVRGDRLYQPGGEDDGRLVPFTSHDYMLLRIEGRDRRDDWEVLIPEIMQARDRAFEALLRDHPEGAQEQRGIALTAVVNSHDLAEADKQQVAYAVNKQWAALERTARGAVPEELPASLPELLARYPMPRATAAALGPLTADELFAS